MLQCPSAPIMFMYHNHSPALLKSVAPREYRKTGVAEFPLLFAAGNIVNGWKRLQPIAASSPWQSKEWISDAHSCWCRMLPSSTQVLWIPLYVESRDSGWHRWRPPFLCAGKWHGPAPDPVSSPTAERQHFDLASLAEHWILHHLADRKCTVLLLCYWWWHQQRNLLLLQKMDYLGSVAWVSPGWMSELISLLLDVWPASGISKYFFLQYKPVTLITYLLTVLWCCLAFPQSCS